MTANPRYANGARRRALRQRILATETHCALCGEEVDKTIPTPHPDSAEIDEIIPISHGGDPLSRTNTQLVHRRCNRAKSNTIAADDASAGAQPARTFVTTLNW